MRSFGALFDMEGVDMQASDVAAPSADASAPTVITDGASLAEFLGAP